MIDEVKKSIPAECDGLHQAEGKKYFRFLGPVS